MMARLPESDLLALSTGVPAQVTPVGSAKTYQGSIWQVSPIIDPATRQGVARIAVPYDRDLRPGGFATAEHPRRLDRRSDASGIGGAERQPGQLRLHRRQGQCGRAAGR